MTLTDTKRFEGSQVFHLALELGPGLFFFIAFQLVGLIGATAILMALMILTLPLGWITARHLPVLPAVSCVLVLLLGGLSLLFADEVFIKMRPTIGQLLFGLIIAVSIAVGHPLPRRALAPLLKLTTRGWSVLSWRWVVIAIVLAALNEAAWRSLPTEDWVTVKTIMSPGGFMIHYIVTHQTAKRYWDKEG